MKSLIVFTSAAVLIFCSTNLPAKDFDGFEAQRHIIVVDHVGRPLRPIITKMDEDHFDVKLRRFEPDSPSASETASSQDYHAYVTNIVKSVGAPPKNKIMFFIHGGMNEKIGAVQRAAKLLDRGDINKEGYYPIFICWDSPPFQTYWENVRWVRAGKTEKYFRGKLYALLTTPFYLLGDVGRAMTRFPAELSALGYNDVYSIYPNKFTEYERMQCEYCYLRRTTDRDKLAATKAPNHRHAGEEILRNISLFATAPFKIASEPIIDAIGVGAWDNMIRRTDTMFDAVPTRGKTPTPIEAEKLMKDEPTGALSIFMTELSKAKPDCEVTLVAHSMGTIIANRIIHQYPDMYYKNIVYMAAACRVFDFENAVLPYMQHRIQQKEEVKFYNLCLHPKCESGEIFYWGKMPLDVPPRGSLLVWIDNIFGYPPSEKRRMFGVFQTALIESHNIPSKVRGQIVYKAFGAGVTKDEAEYDRQQKVNWHPQRHGDFADGPFWKNDFWEWKRNPQDDTTCVLMDRQCNEKTARVEKKVSLLRQ